jgi:hypothetical protein
MGDTQCIVRVENDFWLCRLSEVHTIRVLPFRYLERATFVHIIRSPTLCFQIRVSNSLHSYAVADLVYRVLCMS